MIDLQGSADVRWSLLINVYGGKDGAVLYTSDR